MEYKLSKRRKKTHRISIVLFVVGGISLFYSLVSSVFAFAGIGIVLFIIGGILSIKSFIKKLPTSTISLVAVFGLLVSVSIFPSCGTIKVPMAPDVGKLQIEKKLPVEAGLLITEKNKNYVFEGKPESFTGGARAHEFPLGAALEKASFQAFSQVFKKVHLVRTRQQANEYKIFIEPEIEDFHFRYNQLSYAGFAVAVLSKIKVHVTLASGETKVWEKSIESPEQKKGPWVFNPGYEKEVGESASAALVFTLKTIASEIAQDISIRQFVER
jgi:hypothetical protein